MRRSWAAVHGPLKVQWAIVPVGLLSLLLPPGGSNEACWSLGWVVDGCRPQREVRDAPDIGLGTRLLVWWEDMLREGLLGSDEREGCRLVLPDVWTGELCVDRLLPRSEGSVGHLHDNAVAVEVGLHLGGGSLSGRHVDGWGVLML